MASLRPKIPKLTLSCETRIRYVSHRVLRTARYLDCDIIVTKALDTSANQQLHDAHHIATTNDSVALRGVNVAVETVAH